MQVNPTQANDQLEPEQDQSKVRRKKYDTMFGWAISALLHLLVVAALGGVGLFGTGEGASSEGETTELGISVETSENQQIDDQSPDKIEIKTDQQQLQTTQIIQQIKTEKVVNLDQQATAQSGDLAVKKILSLNSTSSEGQEVTDNQQQWNNFAGSTGQSGNSGSSSSFFGIQARGKTFVYVIDCSGSMHDMRLEAAKLELLRSISALNRRSKFYIIFYNSKALPMPAKHMVRATHNNKQRFFRWVNSEVDADGSTQPAEAIIQAMGLKPNAIFLLSDGDFNERLANHLQTIPKHQRTPIHTIAFFSKNGTARLKQIANLTGGSHKFVSKKSLQSGN